ncbi:quinoprotein dehydrogenase-associated putative ABC transporter substrate-binding protein [Massilia agilis]|uniref:Quinoprotein dehydrogenase-associated putative ABC transporter substrate-binding protein n=1 Tax=Massilia agilis TaxID=1811226 RepID=A0ABT2DF28_9BURK|nr:quinoprotein dehydrogenase-associated putative ABC transporter substrate-binding protein [Massilia agilis]MCS0809857.1 quinoprotein dehydrogenase-associated putative ABC transporter substrate-binding protein [Massilia agilis]
MSSRFPEPLRAAFALLLAGCGVACAAEQPELRVCADPDNPPYSLRDQSGFENRIAQLVADDMGARLTYFWQEQGRGFVRKTMGAGQCDLFIGVPAGFERVLTTRPYYRSTYVAVFRNGTTPFEGFDAEALRSRRIGVQLIGDDLATSPPGYALARAGLIDNVRGYALYGDGPAARRMVDAVASGQIDLALVWGPQAGYFAHRAGLALTPASAPPGLPVPFEFSIAMGVRKGDKALRDRLDEILQRRRADVQAILASYFVPTVAMPQRVADQTGGAQP